MTGRFYPPLPRWRVSLGARPGMALPVRNVPVQLDSFGALFAARAVGRTLPSDEEKVAEVFSLGCADAPQRH